MLDVSIPGFGHLRIAHLVLDYNGTLAVDGALLPRVRRRLHALSSLLRVHVVTADTFGKARAALAGLDCRLTILKRGAEDRAKARYVRRLGAKSVACIGNGRNDRLMLRTAALGIAVVQAEGAAAATVAAADVLAKSVTDALDLLARPRRLIATLRA